MLTYEIVRDLLNYNTTTGKLFWKKLGKGKKKTLEAGTINSNGYLQISINHKLYRANRLIWLYMKGYWPENEIDHINGIRHDNRLENLRHVSHICNMRNKTVQSNNKSGVVGVHWNKLRERWRSTIVIGRKNIYLGSFIDFNKAVKVRWEAELKYNFPNCQTTSTAYLHLKLEGLI